MKMLVFVVRDMAVDSSMVKVMRKDAKITKGKGQVNKTPKNNDNAYLRCGSRYHWARTCRTPQHLAELYKASLKEKKMLRQTTLITLTLGISLT